MSSVTTRRLSTISTTITTPAAAGTGMGSVILAAVAAVGAAAVVLQLGGCATGHDASTGTPVVAEDASWNSPNYREGWYFDDAPTTEVAAANVEHAAYETVEPVVTVETTAAVVATSVADSSAVRTSLFPEFSTVGASAEVSSGDVNLTQVSFAAEGSDFDPDLSPTETGWSSRPPSIRSSPTSTASRSTVASSRSSPATPHRTSCPRSRRTAVASPSRAIVTATGTSSS